MVAFLRWLRSILFGTLNGFVKLALGVALIALVLIGIGLLKGDGLPGNMVLTLDLRKPVADSAQPSPFDIGDANPTVMDIVIALDDAGKDARVKGVLMKLGTGSVSVAQAEEISAAIARLRARGKFVMAYSHGFVSTGLGDYLAASAANEIWMQPQSPFSPSGSGIGSIYLRGLFEKIEAEPQIVKRAEYKSAADMFMEKDMTEADREQLTALLGSVYNSATGAAAQKRKISLAKLTATLDASPQFAESAKAAGLIDKIGYDDDAAFAAEKRAGEGAKDVSLVHFLRAKDRSRNFAGADQIALIQASGEIVDGESEGGGLMGGSGVIASDDMAKTIRDAIEDDEVKAIVLRVDSPGGSVTASDQILNALKKAQAKGKPVVVSMGGLAASGGYFISTYANRIVAQPATITGSIGVLTGKVAMGKSLGLLGIGAEQIGVGKNALFDSPLEPFTPEQLATLNVQVDTIYNDFLAKVSKGRNLPLEQVREIAKGRVWSGADAKQRGLVDELGGVWTAGQTAQQLAKLPKETALSFKRYPLQKGFFEMMGELFGSSTASVRAMQGLWQVMNTQPMRGILETMQAMPRGGVELRAAPLAQRP